jgi:glutamate/tyrosine decarboxylase-like PLP-dependent enzyme
MLEHVASLVLRHLETVNTLPIAPPATPAQIRERIAGYDFAGPMPWAEVLDDAAAMLTQWNLHTKHRRHFGLFNPRPAYSAVLGDILSAAYNPQLAAWSHAPGAVEIEAHLIRYLGSLVGYPADAAAGSFTSGGAEANLTGLLLALSRRFPAVAEGGVRALPGRPVFYASSESHLAWLKIAHSTGLGRNAVRLVPVDRALRMDVRELGRLIEADAAAGHIPFLVAGTAGTTSASVVDPLPDIARTAREHGLAFHVDAAWGGAALVSPKLRGVLAGIEQADSVTIDAHKWLSVPLGAGVFVCRDLEGLRRAFRVSAAYMPAAVDETVDPYSSSNQWSRRFVGLRLFTALAVSGRPGFASMVEHQSAVGERLRSLLVHAGWRLVNTTALPVVCFTGRGLDTGQDAAARLERVAARVVERGNCWISATRLNGQPALRACITSFETTGSDVAVLVRELDEVMAGG